MSSRFVVTGLAGQKKLRGTISVAGAKNAALKGLAASVLFDGPVQYHNLPAIEDVARMQELLRAVGAGTATVSGSMDPALAGKLRASVVLTGPLLARTGRVSFPLPGGDVIGDRPIDLFLSGYQAMGATVQESGGVYTVTAAQLKGAHITFPFISVTATEALMMAATLAKGTTVLTNAAMEPEVVHLAQWLCANGASIAGAGTPTITIVGGTLLQPVVPYTTPPDRIEAGSFILLAAMLGDDVTVANCNPSELGALFALLERAGVKLEVAGSSVRVRGGGPYTSVSARTHEYPGFATDLQALYAVFLTQCQGEATILETIFDGRFRYADELLRMGADITVMNPHKILVRGPRPLVARDLESPDIRAGLAYIFAAAAASGTSTIGNAYMVDRGYEHIEERLQALGLDIKREEV